jgi:hypothetical protein
MSAYVEVKAASSRRTPKRKASSAYIDKKKNRPNRKTLPRRAAMRPVTRWRAQKKSGWISPAAPFQFKLNLN